MTTPKYKAIWAKLADKSADQLLELAKAAHTAAEAAGASAQRYKRMIELLTHVDPQGAELPLDHPYVLSFTFGQKVWEHVNKCASAHGFVMHYYAKGYTGEVRHFTAEAIRHCNEAHEWHAAQARLLVQVANEDAAAVAATLAPMVALFLPAEESAAHV